MSFLPSYMQGASYWQPMINAARNTAGGTWGQSQLNPDGTPRVAQDSSLITQTPNQAGSPAATTATTQPSTSFHNQVAATGPVGTPITASSLPSSTVAQGTPVSALTTTTSNNGASGTSTTSPVTTSLTSSISGVPNVTGTSSSTGSASSTSTTGGSATGGSVANPYVNNNHGTVGVAAVSGGAGSTAPVNPVNGVALIPQEQLTQAQALTLASTGPQPRTAAPTPPPSVTHTFVGGAGNLNAVMSDGSVQRINPDGSLTPTGTRYTNNQLVRADGTVINISPSALTPAQAGSVNSVPSAFNTIGDARRAVYDLAIGALGYNPGQAVIDQYAQMLVDGTATWDNILNGVMTNDQFINSFNGNNSAMVTEWFQSTYGRNPTASEAAYWSNALEYTPTADAFNAFMAAGHNLGSSFGTMDAASVGASNFTPLGYFNDPDNADIRNAYQSYLDGGGTMTPEQFATWHYNSSGHSTHRNFDGITTSMMNPEIASILQQAGILDANGAIQQFDGNSPAIRSVLARGLASSGITADELASYIAANSGIDLPAARDAIDEYFSGYGSINDSGVFTLSADAPQVLRNTGDTPGYRALTSGQASIINSLTDAGALTVGDDYSPYVTNARNLFGTAATQGVTVTDLASSLGMSIPDLVSRMSALGYEVGQGGVIIGAPPASTISPGGTSNSSTGAADNETEMNSLEEMINNFMASLSNASYDDRRLRYYQRPGYGRRYGASENSIRRRTGWGSYISL